MAYLDDLVVYSRTWGEHLGHLREVLRWLQEAGLTAKPMKCRLVKRETPYLGYVVGGESRGGEGACSERLSTSHFKNRGLSISCVSRLP